MNEFTFLNNKNNNTSGMFNTEFVFYCSSDVFVWKIVYFYFCLLSLIDTQKIYDIRLFIRD